MEEKTKYDDREIMTQEEYERDCASLNITLADADSKPLGKYGMMRKAYLRENEHATFTALILKDQLWEHCLEIENATRERIDVIMKGLLELNPAPDKASHPIEWARHMSTLKAQAEEVATRELIYDTDPS